jgi:hypothetical protein
MNPYLGLLFDQMASWFAQIQVVLAGSEEEHAMDLFPESIHQLVWETILRRAAGFAEVQA